MQDTIFLHNNQKMMWAEAGTRFSGEQLDLIIQRTLSNLPTNQNSSFYYEILRSDTPHAFDALLKIQNTGLAKRHIEVDKERHEYREVLSVDSTLLYLIMKAIEMLLDVLLNILGSTLKSSPNRSAEPPEMPTAPQKYIPSWKKHYSRIEHTDDGYSL